MKKYSLRELGHDSDDALTIPEILESDLGYLWKIDLVANTGNRRKLMRLLLCKVTECLVDMMSFRDSIFMNAVEAGRKLAEGEQFDLTEIRNKLNAHVNDARIRHCAMKCIAYDIYRPALNAINMAVRDTDLTEGDVLEMLWEVVSEVHKS